MSNSISKKSPAPYARSRPTGSDAAKRTMRGGAVVPKEPRAIAELSDGGEVCAAFEMSAHLVWVRARARARVRVKG